MTRFLFKATLLLLIIVRLTGAAACSEAGATRFKFQDPVILECWHYYNGAQKEAFDRLIATFVQTVGQERGIQVHAESQGNVAELVSRITLAVNSAAGGTAMPDIFSAYADTAYGLARQGRLASLNKYLKDSDLADFRPEYLNEGRVLQNKDLYILPIAKSSEVVALNLTAWQSFAAANPRFADPAAALATWESVGQSAEAYRNWCGRSMIGLDSLANFLIIGCKQLGIDLLRVADNRGRFNFDRDALHQIWDIYYVNTVQGGFAAFGNYRTDDLKSGQLIAGVVSSASGSWLPDTVLMKDGSGPVDWQILTYPVFRDGQAVCVQQGAGMAVTRSTSRREAAAVILLAWLARPEQNVTFTIPAGYLPVTRSGLQSQLLQDCLDQLGQTGTASCLKTCLRQLAVCQLYYAPAFTGSLEIRNLLDESLARIAGEARQSWLSELAGGVSQEKLQARFFNDAAFEQWYSQLVLEAGRLLDQN